MPPRFWDLAHECGHAAYAKLVGIIDMLNLGSLATPVAFMTDSSGIVSPD